MKHKHKWVEEEPMYIYHHIADHRCEWCSICGAIKIYSFVSGKTWYKRPLTLNGAKKFGINEDEIYREIAGCCVSDESASVAARRVAKLVEKFASSKKDCNRNKMDENEENDF